MWFIHGWIGGIPDMKRFTNLTICLTLAGAKKFQLYGNNIINIWTYLVTLHIKLFAWHFQTHEMDAESRRSRILQQDLHSVIVAYLPEYQCGRRYFHDNARVIQLCVYIKWHSIQWHCHTPRRDSSEIQVSAITVCNWTRSARTDWNNNSR